MDATGNKTITERPDDLTGKIIGRFQITSFIGKGGMGEVYRADDPLLKRTVALKRLSPALRSAPMYRDLLIREAERASRLNDDHVAHVHDVLEAAGEIFVVMEYVDGVTLREKMKEGIKVQDFIPTAIQCVQALAAAHQSGIIHRDIKPENIMITSKGRVKVCDFGLALNVPTSSESTIRQDSHASSTFRGTPAYMAPEALLLHQNIDGRVDIFSLGVVFYEVLTGKHPFLENNNYVLTVDRILHSTPAPASSFNAAVPQTLSKIVAKMLQREPDDRHADVEELLAELKALETVSAPVAPPVLTRKTKWIAASILVAIILVAGLLFRGGRGDQKPLLPSQRNLVVLPFTPIGKTVEARSYSDGLTEALTARLTRFTRAPGLTVAPATEVRAKNVNTAGEAAKLFGANIVLAGTVQEESGLVRVNYSLYDAATSKVIRADTLSTEGSSLFLLEDRLIRDLLEGLDVGFGSAPLRDDGSHGTNNGRAYLFYLQGRGYLRNPNTAGNIGLAVEAFQRALDVDPAYSAAHAELGGAYYAQYESTGEPAWIDSARSECNKSVALDPKTAQGKVCMARLQAGTGHYDQAETTYNEALDIDPTNDDAYRGLALAQESLGHFELTERTFNRSIQLKPDYYLGYARLGAFYIRRARYKEALETYRKEEALVPNDADVYVHIAAASIFLGDYESAINASKTSIELRPNASAFSNLGSAYLRQRKFEDALLVFQRAVGLYPRSFIVAGNLARTLYWTPGRRPEAPAAYNRAIGLANDALKINPKNADAHIMIARYLVMIGQNRAALQHLQTALKLRPKEPEYFSIAAVVRNQVHDAQGTIAALRQAVQLGWPLAEINSELEFDNLRSDPGFQEILKQH